MRELILKMTLSLDGFASDLEDRNNWMFGTDQEAKAWSADCLWQGGLHIMGSRTFRDMAAWWPTATGPFAAPMNQIPKAVFSRRGAELLADVAAPPAEAQQGAESWAGARVCPGDLAAEIAALKAEAGKPIIAHGGVTFARSLVAAGLVDQFALMVPPVALGRGKPLFADLAAPLHMTLADSKAFPGGAMAKVYRVG